MNSDAVLKYHNPPIHNRVASALSMDPEQIDLEKSLYGYGVDSLNAVEVRIWNFRGLKADISIFDILSNISIRSLAIKIIVNSKSVKHEIEQIAWDFS
jgi:aryl carrier-like protein